MISRVEKRGGLTLEIGGGCCLCRFREDMIGWFYGLPAAPNGEAAPRTAKCDPRAVLGYRNRRKRVDV
jgi:hypothetical protein